VTRTLTDPRTARAPATDADARAEARARARRVARARRHGNRAVFLFLGPWFLGLFGLTLGPIIASLYLSFTDFQLLSGEAPWVGLDNYQGLLDDRHYRNALRVTFIYVVASVPLSTLAALLVAVMLNGRRRGIGLYRATYYLPSLLGGSVAIAVLWRQIFGEGGLVNQLLAWSRLDQVLQWFGIEPGTGWIVNPDYAIYTLVALHVWQFGAPMVIFLAGLKQIPQDLLEAAAVDGAGRFARFWRVTVPLLSPLIFFNLVLGTIGAFKAFTPAYVVSNGEGGPADATMFYTLYLYRVGFRFFDMGAASAMAWVLLLIISVFTAGMFLTARYWVYYGDQVKLR
jgi:multiple sugar transport system permease protein